MAEEKTNDIRECVDDVIRFLCSSIKDKLRQGDYDNAEKLTKALAELYSARAKY